MVPVRDCDTGSHFGFLPNFLQAFLVSVRVFASVSVFPDSSAYTHVYTLMHLHACMHGWMHVPKLARAHIRTHTYAHTRTGIGACRSWARTVSSVLWSSPQSSAPSDTGLCVRACVCAGCIVHSRTTQTLPLTPPTPLILCTAHTMRWPMTLTP